MGGHTLDEGRELGGKNGSIFGYFQMQVIKKNQTQYILSKTEGLLLSCGPEAEV